MGCCGSKEKPDPNPAQTAEVIEKMTVLLECPCVEKATKKGLKMVLSDLEKDDLEDFNVKQKQSIVQNKEMPPQIKQMMLKLVMFKMDYKKIIAAQAEEWREDGTAGLHKLLREFVQERYADDLLEVKNAIRRKHGLAEVKGEKKAEESDDEEPGGKGTAPPASRKKKQDESGSE